MIAFEKIKHYLKLFRGLRLHDLNAFFKNSRKITLQPNETFIKEESRKRVVGYIEEGLIRAYKLNEKGEEITTTLYWEGRFVASHDIILFERPSNYTYEAIEPTKLIVIDYDVMQKIITKNPKFEEARKYFLLRMIKGLTARVDSFVLLKPEERYLELIESNPSLANRLPDKYIAHIIGITPVSLSRIRKRISKK